MDKRRTLEGGDGIITITAWQRRICVAYSNLRLLAIAERHLTHAITQRFAGMSRKELVAKIRKLASASGEDEKFVRKTFPDLYWEAFLAPRHNGALVTRNAVYSTRKM